MMTVKNIMETMLDNYKKVVVTEYKNNKRTGNRWIVPPHKSYHNYIPINVIYRNVYSMVLYHDGLYLDIIER